jgi:hypothetical protein
MRMVTGGQDELRPIMQCAGYYHHDCEGLVKDISFSRAAQHARETLIGRNDDDDERWS